MISEEYDHRWEALAEVHFSADDEISDENYIYCLCSRVHIRDGVKLYFVEKEEGSESDVEVLRDSKLQDVDDESHVHFSLDTSYKVKCEKDEGASCYCSASHTDNYCSTDEHDPAQIHGVLNALQPSDSGADLTYQEGHSDYNVEKSEKMDQDYPVQTVKENYGSENSWDKFWAINGERIIWASWIANYSDYINPAYLEENNDLVQDDSPKEKVVDQIIESKNNLSEDDGLRVRKFSYDSKVNPYKKSSNTEKLENKNEISCNKDDTWLNNVSRRRSCSEHERMVSPRPLTTTDSMTNVTKITYSSYDVTSSHVTSISDTTPTDDYSVSSSTSDDQSNDQTRIANLDENLEKPLEEMDSDEYWQFLWKKHFGEQYAFHYASYIESHDKLVSVAEQKKDKLEVEFENSDNNSQDTPTVIEVQNQVDKMKLEEKSRPKKRNKKSSTKYTGSVGVLLQNLLKEEQKRTDYDENEVTEAGEGGNKKESSQTDVVDSPAMEVASTEQSEYVDSNTASYRDDGGDEPPEDRQFVMKRSHEIDEEEISSQKIKSTFEMMGLCLGPESTMKGQLMYRKRFLRPPQLKTKKFGTPKKTYFDDEGNPCNVDQPQDSNEEREMPTDEDCAEEKTDCEKSFDVPNKTSEVDSSDMALEASAVPLPPEDASCSDRDNMEADLKDDGGELPQGESSKRRRRKRRRSPARDVTPPADLAQPHMIKYWRKRHSLFNRFDSGIRLDAESWFSVTPERVARHCAARCRADLLLDAFTGAGGNAIQFAFTCERVIAIDIDPVKIEMARHNAAVYGVSDRIEFIVGDFFALAPTLKADVVFLSPPWGGPKYSENTHYDLETMLEPKPASELMEAAQGISGNIALYVPRNCRTEQLVSLAKHSGAVEIEQNFLGRRFVALTAYYGDLVNY